MIMIKFLSAFLDIWICNNFWMKIVKLTSVMCSVFSVNLGTVKFGTIKSFYINSVAIDDNET